MLEIRVNTKVKARKDESSITIERADNGAGLMTGKLIPAKTSSPKTTTSKTGTKNMVEGGTPKEWRGINRESKLNKENGAKIAIRTR